jgi:hypothetical protein
MLRVAIWPAMSDFSSAMCFSYFSAITAATLVAAAAHAAASSASRYSSRDDTEDDLARRDEVLSACIGLFIYPYLYHVCTPRLCLGHPHMPESNKLFSSNTERRVYTWCALAGTGDLAGVE